MTPCPAFEMEPVDPDAWDAPCGPAVEWREPVTATDPESIFANALDADPGDHLTRLAYADWLDEHAVCTPCRECGGAGYERDDWFPGDEGRRSCPACSGTGAVSDGRRERASGYRALAVLGHRPHLYRPLGSSYLMVTWTWWASESYETTGPDYLPFDWVVRIWEANTGSHRDAYHKAWVEFLSRRQAEDAAAISFSRLPEARRRELLAGAVPQTGRE